MSDRKSTTIVHLPATTTLTPPQALYSALGMDLTDVLIVGYDQDGDFCVRSSRMTRADALWLTEKLRQWCLEGGL